MSENEPADLADKATLFQAYVDLINSERETIWARHNALLVANSLIVGASTISSAEFWSNRWTAVGLLGAGVLISTAWFLITLNGWWVMRRHADMASAFASTHFKHLPNPFADIAYNRSGTWIHILALTVVGTFIAIYIGMGFARLSAA